MSVRRFFFCATILLLCANGASAARYQRCQDGKTLVWNSLRGVAQESSWSGLRDSDGYATGEGTLTWYRLGNVVNRYTGKMVRGKFEGVVIKEQAGTRLQTKFLNGEKAGGWSQPGEAEAPSATPPPKQEKVKPTPTAAPAEESEPQGELSPTTTPPPRRTPTPPPTATPTAKPTATPSPIATPTPTPTPTPRPTPTPTPRRSTSITPTPSPILTPPPSATPVPTRSPTPTPSAARTLATAPIKTPTPPQLKSSPSPSPSPAQGSLSLERGTSGPTRDALDMVVPQTTPRSVLPTAPWSEPPTLATPASKSQDRNAPSASAAATPAMHEFAGSKTEMIVEFKKETGGVLAQVKKATQNFRELEGIDNVQMLPPEISESISSLANQSRDFRTKLGYEAAMYECGPETATSEALVAVDQALRDLNQKNAPAGRMKILNFIKRYPLPARDNQKPLWRYAASVLNACDLARKSAEQHLERARSLEAAGNKSEALREYQEIYRVYPNAITADKIQLLQNEAH